MKNEIEDLVDKLRPILGSKVDRLLLASRVTDPASAQIYRSAILALAAKHLGNLDEKILLPPPTKEQATSEYQPLGTVVYNGLELFPFGLHESEWTSHTAVLGRSGSGKTNAVRILLQSLHEKGKPYLVVDWKQDYFPSDALWVTAGHDLEFNPLVPPVPLTGDAYRDYLKGVVELFVQAYFRDMQLLTVEGLRNLLLEKLDALCTKHGTYTGSGTYPTFRAIQDEIQTTKSKVIAYARDSLLSVLQAIGFGTTNRVFNTTRSLDISKLLENNVVLKLHSLGSTADKAFLCMSLVNSIYTYRLQQPSPEFKHAIIAEEYHNMDSPYMRYVFRMIRSLGEAIVLCDQHPSKLTVETLGNTYSVICFNLRHQADVQAASRAMLLPQDQWDALGRLEVGQAIVKLQGRYARPFLINVPLIKGQDENVTGSDGGLERFLTDLNSTLVVSKPPMANQRDSRLADRPLTTDETALLDDVCKYPDDVVKDRRSRVGMTWHRILKARNGLEAKGLVDVSRVSTRTGSVVFIHPTTKAVDFGSTTLPERLHDVAV